MHRIALVGSLLVALLLVGCDLTAQHSFQASVAGFEPVDHPAGYFMVRATARDETAGQDVFFSVIVPINEWGNVRRGESFRATCMVDFLGGIHLNTCLAKRQDTSN